MRAARLECGQVGCHYPGMYVGSDTERLSRAPDATRSANVAEPSVMTEDGPEAVVSRPRRRSRLRETLKWLLSIGILLVLAPPLFILSVMGAVYWQANTNQLQPADAIVVLGAAQYDGRPSPVLKARLDQALTVYHDHLAPLIIVTGGREPGDRFTEAETSHDYLVAHGVPEAAILLENNGRTTWQSMQAVAAMMKQRHLTRMLAVSDGFHLFRVKVMAHHLGLTAYGSPAANSPIRRGSANEFGYIIRETGGVLDFLVTK